MIVDDEQDMAAVAHEMLAAAGYRAVAFSDCAEALRYYRDRPGEVDLTLLDMVMPGMNGCECFAEIKKANPAARALLVTGYAVDDTMRAALESGVAAVVKKPFDAGTLTRAVRDAIAPVPANGPAPAAAVVNA